MPAEYHIYRDTLGHWRWYLRTTDGRRLAESGEFYARREECEHAVALVRQLCATAAVVDQRT